MKEYQIKPFTAAPKATVIERMPSLLRRLGVLEKLHPEHAARAPVCIGADLEKAGACLAIQVGAESVAGTTTLCRADLAALCKELLGRGWHVAVGVEACGFGWVFQAQLREAGAEVFTYATEALTGKRKTKQSDAAALCGPAHAQWQRVAARCARKDARAGALCAQPNPCALAPPAEHQPHGLGDLTAAILDGEVMD